MFSSSWMPSTALARKSSPSCLNGMVTTPTVSMPFSLAILAMTGDAPVPVPPPIPAVMKSIWVPVSITLARISSWDSSAALRPLMGLVPAPRPSPSCILQGTLLLLSAWLSVLQTMKLQPSMCWLYI